MRLTMNQIYSNAYQQLLNRIKSCGRGIQCALDEYSYHYWTQELAKANMKRIKLERRFTPNNVIQVDFQSKKRKAA